MKAGLATCFLLLTISPAYADPLTCTLTGYKAMPGLSAGVADNALTLTWEGDRGQELRMRFTLVSGAPTIQDLAVRKAGGRMGRAGLERDAGLPGGLGPPAHEQPADDAAARAGRRAHRQHRRSFSMGAVLGRAARVVGTQRAPGQPAAGRGRRQSAGPAPQAGGDHARERRLPRDGLRREDQRRAHRSDVSRRAARRLHRRAAVFGVQGQQPDSAGHPGDDHRSRGWPTSTTAGLKGLSTATGTRVAWRDIANNWQDYRFGGAANEQEVPLRDHRPRRDRRTRRGRFDCGVSAAAHVLLGARDRDQPRLQLL